MHKGNTGGRQGQGDKEAWSLDDVVYYTQVREPSIEMIKDKDTAEGVFIRDLYLESAFWGKGGLEDPPEKKNFYQLPILYVSCNRKKEEGLKSSTVYACPVYKYPRRTDKYLIFRVNLECGTKQPSFWKLRGVALHCFTEN